jgi:hypothetical protein
LRHEIQAKPELLAPTVSKSLAGLAELGSRAAYFAKIGDAARALALIEEGRKAARHPDVSDWKKLEFHRGAARGLRGARLDCAKHEAIARKIAADFELRNGNAGASEQRGAEF